MPSTSTQIVEHLEGGILREILVAEGAPVQSGDVLLRVQNLAADAELRSTETDLAGLLAKKRRLEFEANGDQGWSHAINGNEPFLINERRLFERRRENLTAQAFILEEQARQKAFELEELSTRRVNLGREARLIQQQIDTLGKLVAAGAASRSELVDYITERQRLRTRMDDLDFQIPRVEAELSEARSRAGELSLRFRAEADAEMTEVDVEIEALRARIKAFKDREDRSDVRAPVSGVVNKLIVNTIGSVVEPGKPLVEIVPNDETIVIEARLRPADRASIWPGQEAIVKISAYDYAIFGGLQGLVNDISADVLEDENDEPYFRVRLSSDAAQLGPKHPVVPGMTADVDILTGKQTILSALLKPLSRVRERALRE